MELWERIGSPRVKDCRKNFKLSGRCGKSGFLIFLIPDFSSDVVRFFELLPGDAYRFEDVIQTVFKGIPPVISLPHPAGKVIEHFMIRAALTYLYHLAPREKIAVAFPEITDIIHFKPGGCGQNNISQFGGWS